MGAVAPRRVVFDHRVQNQQEMSHAGREGEFGGFARGPQPLIVGGNDGVAPNRTHGRHVEHGANRRTAAADDAFTAEAPRVACKRGEPREGGNLYSGSAFANFAIHRC